MAGCRFGIFADDEVKTFDILDESNAVTRLKFEGLLFDGFDQYGRMQFIVVADMDDTETPAFLDKLTVSGAP